MTRRKIKAGDTVLVVAGKDKSHRGTVLKVYPETDRILVEGINRVVRHTRVTPGQGGSKAGGLIHTESPIHISNVKLLASEEAADTDDKPSKKKDKS